MCFWQYAELWYSPLMKMHHQTVHITLSKQDLCPGFSKKEKNLSKIEKGLETKGKDRKCNLLKF